MKSKYCPIVTLGLLSFVSIGNAGSIAGNGGEFSLNQDNPWFVGRRTVHYCFEREKTFPIKSIEVERTIESALSKWKSFFKKYGMDTKMWGMGEHGRFMFKDKIPKGLSLEFLADQTCSPSTDLVFKIGYPVDTTDFNPFLIGKSVRESYDLDTYWAKGAVYVAPDAFLQTAARNHPSWGGNLQSISWGKHPSLFEHIILHELGHIFGMKHDSVYVMQNNVADEILRAMNTSDMSYYKMFGNIETSGWKYRLRAGDRIFLSFDEDPTAQNRYIPDSLRNLLGVKEAGTHVTEIMYSGEDPSSGLHQFKLLMSFDSNEIKEYSGEFRLVWTRNNFRPYLEGPGIFTTWWGKSGGQDFTQRVGLDDTIDPLPADGYFEIEGRKFPVTLIYDRESTSHRGFPVMKIFTGENEGWWIVR